MEKKKTVFISYSWDSEAHQKWVRKLSDALERMGIHTILDQKDLVLGDLLTKFMEDSIHDSDYVLMILTPTYKKKTDERKAGVGYEESMITGDVYANGNHRKYIPVLASGTWDKSTPVWAKGKLGLDMTNPAAFEENVRKLAETIMRTDDTSDNVNENAEPVPEKQPAGPVLNPTAKPIAEEPEILIPKPEPIAEEPEILIPKPEPIVESPRAQADHIFPQGINRKDALGKSFYLGSIHHTQNGSRLPEVLEWLVLKKESDRTLLISRYAVDCHSFSMPPSAGSGVSWKTSFIRHWLNTEFPNLAFGSLPHYFLKTLIYDETAKDWVRDTFFLLSEEEVMQYFKSDRARKCSPTKYAVSHGASANSHYDLNGSATCWWWLRTMSSDPAKALSVYYDGSVNSVGTNVSYSDGCIRPAVWIRK